MKIFIVIALALCASLAFATFPPPADQTNPATIAAGEQDVEKTKDKKNIREVTRKIFMRGKLASNQKIVEGLTTRNFDKIAQGADEVTALVKGQHWLVIDSKEYKQYSAEMARSASQLHAAAENKNIDAAALRYFDLTLNCLDCHRYIESRKY